MTTITARDITAVMRELHPRPVRLSVRARPGSATRFLLAIPWASDQGDDKGVPGRGWPWLDGYLTRHLGVPIACRRERVIRHRDYSHSTEWDITVGSQP